MREAEHCELCFSFFIPYAGTESEYASIESVSDQNFLRLRRAIAGRGGMRARAASRGFVFLRLCGSRDSAVKEEIRALSDLKAILYRIIIRAALHSDGFQLAP